MMERDSMSINRKLKQYLADHGIKQTWLASKTGLNKFIISQIINSNRKITGEELIKISEVLGVTTDLFLQ